MLEDAISAAEERKAKAKTRTRWPFGYKGEPDDVPIPEGKTSAVISRLLERAEVDAGEFSVGGQADVLPSIPGLFIGGIDGCVPVPLTEERKYQILSVCEANVTKKTQDDIDIDGNSKNTWTLSPDQVKMKNPEWESGMQKLTQLVGDRLGFKRMKLTCEMKSLVVHGPGAKMRKQQKTKEDGVVATLVVQLPSEHSGGDLVVYRGRDVEFRHDFGVQKGVAAYLPHYAAYFADAPCARVEVISGFQLMLTYALSLPVEMKYLEGAKGDIPLSDELAEVLKEVEPEDECFGLLLESEYSEITILSKGAGALTEMDNTRYRALLEANSLVPEDKAMVFYIAQLARKVQHYDGRLGAHRDPRWTAENAFWQEFDRTDCVTWYSNDGTMYGDRRKTMYCNFVDGGDTDTIFTPTLLNPGRRTLSELWRAHDTSLYDGSSGDKMRGATAYRYAVFAWPATKNLDYTFNFVNIEAAAAALQTQKSVDAGTLRKFMERANEKPSEKEESRASRGRRSYNDDSQPDTLPFCQTMIELIVKAGDATLVAFLLENFFGGVKNMNQFTNGFCLILNTFKWADVKDAVLKALNLTTSSSSDDDYSRYRWGADEEMKLTLRVIDSLECGEAQTALLRGVVEKASSIAPEKLVECESRKLLWKCAVRSEDVAVLEMVVGHFKKIKPNNLDGVIDAASEYTDALDTQDKKFTIIASLAELRMEWLNKKLDKLDKPFTWEMPDASFIDNARVQAFLRGPESTMTTRGLVYFRNQRHAQRWTRHKQTKASFELTAEGTGREAFVTIAKTRRHYEAQQNRVEKFKAEKEKLLVKRFKDSASSTGKKRPREEEKDVAME
ncbi:hypothetical protein PRNP1_002182 [Phytophthora ramorum]